MTQLKLIKGRSYTGYGVKVFAERLVVEIDDKKVADGLLSSGYFAFIGEASPTNGDNAGGEKPLAKMTEKELETYAAENGIDLAGLSRKADKLERIRQALSDSNEDNGNDLFNDED